MRHFLLAGLLLTGMPFVAAASCLEGLVFTDANGIHANIVGVGAYRWPLREGPPARGVES